MMNIEQLIPLVVVYLIWRALTRRQRPTAGGAPAPMPTPVPFAFDQYLHQEEEVTSPSRPLSSDRKPGKQRDRIAVPSPLAAVDAENVVPEAMDRVRSRSGVPSRRQLRQAIVWSEILQPPSGLR